MIRIIGFCTGAMLSLGALLLLIGTPDFHRGAEDADQERIDAAIENLRRKWEEQEARAPAVASTGADAESAPSKSTAEELQSEGSSPVELPVESSVELAPVLDPEWHAVWTPFRTEIAAQGFVSRLESVTGLDYRVAKLRNGAWEVAFAYRDPTERDAALERISAATGLDLSADPP